jgi:type IV pilus assembly protein PilV
MSRASNNVQAGFSLIEALVSLIVISVGMIGIASLYGQGLRAGGTALYRTQAINLASDMADRIRVNRRGGAGYNAMAANNQCDPPNNVTCTPAQMAAHDKFVWAAQIAALLPNGAGTVNYVGSTPPTYTIRVTWEDAGFGQQNYQLAIRVPDL